ncbi:MAG TPA: prenyltransferase/squalene oxidase repeat-containing protein [Planctomycetota bacterium]|nr:prenyltransferase/squalene oxidase repeat-containing protein [Planctomycetota bacterium]
MKLSPSRFLLLAVCSIAAAAQATARPLIQIGGPENTQLAKAKTTYEQGIVSLRLGLNKLILEKRHGLTPLIIPAKFDLVAVNEDAARMEREVEVLELEGEWPASIANDVVLLTSQRTLKAALEDAYKKAFDAASSNGDSKARDIYAKELTAFRAISDLASWKPLVEAASVGSGASAWVRSAGGLLSPAYDKAQAPPPALQVPASAIPWHPQYKLELVIEKLAAGGPVLFKVLDAAGRPVEFRLTLASLDAVSANRLSGKPGAALVFSVQDGLVKIELEGRTLDLLSSEPAAAGAGTPAPEKPLLEVLPEGGTRIRLHSIAWRALRGIKQESVLANADPARPVDCGGKPQMELLTVIELARAKADYEEALRLFCWEVGTALTQAVQRAPNEDPQAASDRMRQREDEARLLDKEGTWPASLRNDIATVSKSQAIRRALTVAYAKAGSEANRENQACLRRKMACELEAFQACTDFASYRSMLPALVAEKGRDFDPSHPICPLKFAGLIPAQYKIEFLLTREGDGEGVLIRGMEPSSGPFEYHVSKFELDAAVGGGIFKKGGARILVHAQPGYARIEMEGMTLFQRIPGDEQPEAAPSAAANAWLEITPDAGTRLIAKSIQWKPLVAVPAANGETPAGKKPAPGAAPSKPAKDAGPSKPAKDAGPVKDGLEWLKCHQSSNGSWDCDGFMSSCGQVQKGAVCDGKGEATHDVGMTGLAILAFQNGGSSSTDGPYKEQIVKATQWLVQRQDASSGLYGEKLGNSFMYNHAIATLAVCEALESDPTLKASAQNAINFIAAARNPEWAWRYSMPPTGANDTSVTGWCVFAMASARDGGLLVNPACFDGATRWIDSVTDQETGRTGYDEKDSPSARVPGKNDTFPTDKGEAMTAISLRVRYLLDKRASKYPLVKKQLDLLSSHPPEWDATGLYNDIYYWYYGTHAMSQAGGKSWEAWKTAVTKALTESQQKTGDAKGSWNPEDAWAKHAGGRVFMTAMAVLCLEEAKRPR